MSARTGPTATYAICRFERRTTRNQPNIVAEFYLETIQMEGDKLSMIELHFIDGLSPEVEADNDDRLFCDHSDLDSRAAFVFLKIFV